PVGLHLDDLGTEVAEHLRGVRTHHDGGEVEDAHAVERARSSHATHVAIGRAHGASGPTSTTGSHVRSTAASSPARRASTRKAPSAAPPGSRSSSTSWWWQDTTSPSKAGAAWSHTCQPMTVASPSHRRLREAWARPTTWPP